MIFPNSGFLYLEVDIIKSRSRLRGDIIYNTGFLETLNWFSLCIMERQI